MKHTALIIDDEADIRELIAMSLDRVGMDTHTAANLDEAKHLLATYQFDVCLTDMRLPDGNGVEFVKYIHQVQPLLPVAVITAHGNMDAAVEAMKNGAFDFVSKPVDIKLLRSLVSQAIDSNNRVDDSDSVHLNQKPPSPNARLSSKDAVDLVAYDHIPDNSITAAEPDSPVNTSSLETLSGRHNKTPSTENLVGEGRLIGQSEPMQALRSMIKKVARTNAPVWITGESGTGKELIARLVHENSPRSQSPFIAINCGAIPSELMESEMFGHRKGSFTGAHSDHEGLFKRADGGTLFLDEVAELPLSMQVKLLRAIQERSIRPVGGTDEIDTNVRILSASHKDLASEVTEGRFRHDLYYRLNVICIKSPSLRDRANDVSDIARHILRNIAKADGTSQPVTLTAKAQCALEAYAFPGNVRELENILERAVAMSEGQSIVEEDLDLASNPSQLSYPYSRQDADRPMSQASEQQLIEQTLIQTRWNRKAAAQQLGMTYRQLRYRIQQYSIDEKKTGT